MNIGKLDRLVTIQAYTTSRSSSGEPLETWANLTNGIVWASLRNTAASEKVENEQLVAIVSTTWNIRYLSTVNETQRILYNSKYYYITGIKIHGRNEFMELTTELRDN
mgnify:CR=1 FL=1|jgi:SPP1 family predicted phage head-tail adaptor